MSHIANIEPSIPEHNALFVLIVTVEFFSISFLSLLIFQRNAVLAKYGGNTITPVILSIVFHASFEKYTNNIAHCIKILVIQSETFGEPFAFSLLNAFGNVPSFAAENTINTSP